MCEIITIGNSTAIICGAKKDHKCNESAIVYGTSDGNRFYFKTNEEAKNWYYKTDIHITIGSVACSICGSAAIDSAPSSL